MPKRKPPQPLFVDGTTAVKISFHLVVNRGPRQRVDAHYVIEYNTCRLTWDYEPPPSFDTEYCLPLSQLQCPDGCEPSS